MGPLISKESVVLRDCKCKAPVIHCHPRAATVRKKNLFRERTGKNVPLVMYQSFHRHIFTHYLLITTSCLRSPWKERGLSWWQQKSAAWKGMWQQSPLGCMSQRAALAWAARRSKAPQSQSQQLELQKRVCWAHQTLSLSQWIDTAMPGQIRLIQEPVTQRVAQDVPEEETFVEQAHKSTEDQTTNIIPVQDFWSCCFNLSQANLLPWQPPPQLMGLARQRMSHVIPVSCCTLCSFAYVLCCVWSTTPFSPALNRTEHSLFLIKILRYCHNTNKELGFILSLLMGLSLKNLKSWKELTAFLHLVLQPKPLSISSLTCTNCPKLRLSVEMYSVHDYSLCIWWDASRHRCLRDTRQIFIPLKEQAGAFFWRTWAF